MFTTPIKISFSFLATAIIVSCGQNKKENTSEPPVANEVTVETINVDQEIESWKKDLISNNILGEPCDNVDVDLEKRQEWASNNDGLLDGFPSDKSKIHVAKADFDDDAIEDVLLYFTSQNCTGHNGGTPSFAKLIYANGQSNANLAKEITEAILADYNKKRQTVYSMKEVTENYLPNNLSINYENNRITGDFRLYAKDDAHCCPTYNGTYKYDPKTGEIETDIIQN